MLLITMTTTKKSIYGCAQQNRHRKLKGMKVHQLCQMKLNKRDSKKAKEKEHKRFSIFVSQKMRQIK